MTQVDDGRARSSERSRQKLLDAAFDEFAEHGYAGARVASIAERAGVNKQLISYHFGGKRGLYEQLQSRWRAQETRWRSESTSLSELAVRYLRSSYDDARGARLAVQLALEGGPPVDDSVDEEIAHLRRAQQRGELAADLDPGAFLLAIMGIVTAPTLHPQLAEQLLPGGQEQYAEQLRRILAHLAE